jgi:hypothetical protein
MALPAHAALGQHGGGAEVAPWGEVASKGEVAWAQALPPNHHCSKTV